MKGLIVAPFTAFTPDGEIDVARVGLQAKYYRDNGISGVFACGTTGEGSALTLGERKRLLSEWAKYRGEDLAVIAFIGGTSVKEAQELACHAAECGLDAVAMTAPYYQKAANVHELALTLAEVAAWYREHEPKGEIVIVVAGAEPARRKKRYGAAEESPDGADG